MATAAPISRNLLDNLGEALASLGYPRATLSFGRDHTGEYFFLDGETAHGRFFSGCGDTPSEALTAAERSATRPELHGVYLDG